MAARRYQQRPPNGDLSASGAIDHALPVAVSSRKWLPAEPAI